MERPARPDASGRPSTVNLSSHTVVDRDRGLPSSQVHRMAHDSRHRLWLAGPDRLTALAGSGARERVTVPLIAPRELVRPGEKGHLAPLRSNGHLVLELFVAG